MPNLNHRLCSAVAVFLVFCAPAHGATCDAGFYLDDAGECAICNPGATPFYCPGDDIRYPCPTTDTDYNQFGYILIGGVEAGWTSVSIKAISASNCISSLYFRDEYGNEFLSQNSFNGENYWGNSKLWYKVVAGFYLSGYNFTTGKDWYGGVKPCTNEIPAHSHYSGAGTPDEPKSGGITDYNDCPWACDDGYGLHDGECVPLCASGVQYIKTGGGLTFNLYPVAYSSPALHVKYKGTVCYGVLAGGTGSDTVNINYNGQRYHLVD